MTTAVDLTQLTIGDVLRKARRAAGLTQQQVAARIGTSQASVSRWENGDDCPTLWEFFAFREMTGNIIDLRDLPITWEPESAGQERVLVGAR